MTFPVPNAVSSNVLDTEMLVNEILLGNFVDFLSPKEIQKTTFY